MPVRRGIQIFNRQRLVRFDLAWLRQFASAALHDLEEAGLRAGQPLAALEEVEASVVSDRTIAAVHWKFMKISGPADVITFAHGEIVIGAQTAARQAREYGHPLEHELGLYVIHGLLHLNGYDDNTAPERAAMEEAQSSLLGRCLPRAGTPARA